MSQDSRTIDARFERYAAYIAAALALAAGLYVVDRLPVGGFYDDAFYVILAKSLATGHGYRNLNLPGAPFATHYPPGYPLFLAALWKIGPAFPANLVWFKAANAVFLSVTAGAACVFARARLGLAAGVAFVATLAGTVTTPALYLSCMILSECMFLALLLPLLVWAERATERVEIGTAMALGACGGVLFLVRSQAIAVIGAIAVAYAMRRHWKNAAVSLAAAVAIIAPWLLWVRAHDSAVPVLMRGDYGSYFAWFVDGLRERGVGLVTATLRRNLPDMFQHVVHRMRPFGNPLPGFVASLSALVLGVLGFVRIARRARVTFFFLLAYLAIVAVWPFPPVRFLLGIWVLLMLVLAAGVQSVWELRRSAGTERARQLWMSARIAGATAALVLLAGAVAYNVRGYERHFWRNNEELSARWIAPKLEWARANTDSSAIIGTDHDEGSVYLYTGRRAVPITTFTATEYLEPRPLRVDIAVLTELATHFGARHLLVSSPRLREAAVALGGKGVPLGDGTHQLVPWAYTLPALAWRARTDSLTLHASR